MMDKIKKQKPQLEIKNPSAGDAARNAFFGIWKDREDIGDSVEYQRRLRSEWDREWDK